MTKESEWCPSCAAFLFKLNKREDELWGGRHYNEDDKKSQNLISTTRRAGRMA